MPITIRTALPGDAEAITAFFAAVDHETHFLLFEPGERTRGAHGWRARIEEIRGEDHNEIFVAVDDAAPSDLAGLLFVLGETRRRIKHSISPMVAVREAYAGQGIATRLFAAMEEWARERGIYRIHLQVQCDNHRAVALYHRLGYRVEGLHRCAVRVDGRWVDDYTMAKLLE
jgi:RimJ/RimL family protein N-acetyltransferase